MSPPFSKPRIEDSQKRIRVLFAGTIIVDTKQAKLVWEHQYYPVYYFPLNEVPNKYLSGKKSGEDGDTYDIVVGNQQASGAAKVFSTPSELSGLIKIVFGTMHAWFEEDEQIYIHPKDPYKRVDVLQSSRHVRIEVNGVEVANTHKPKLLFETGLPVRTYIPKTDCRLDLLKPSDLTTACPYKVRNFGHVGTDSFWQGVANYYNVQVSPNTTVENIVWWYRNPNLECAAISGYAAFYDEKVDVWVDGEKQARPVTKFG